MLTKQQILNLSFIVSLKEIGFTDKEILDMIAHGQKTN